MFVKRTIYEIKDEKTADNFILDYIANESHICKIPYRKLSDGTIIENKFEVQLRFRKRIKMSIRFLIFRALFDSYQEAMDYENAFQKKFEKIKKSS